METLNGQMCYIRQGVGFWACETCRNTRKERREYTKQVRALLDQCIPPLYRSARVSQIGPKVAGLMNHRFGAVLFGPMGTGKTHAVCAYLRSLIVNHMADRVARTTWDRLLLEIRQSFGGQSSTSELQVIQPYMDADVLALEDIGATVGLEKTETDFSNRILMVLLDSRMEQLRPTIFTTNKTQEAFAKSVNPRIASRLQAFRWVGIGGKDRRSA